MIFACQLVALGKLQNYLIDVPDFLKCVLHRIVNTTFRPIGKVHALFQRKNKSTSPGPLLGIYQHFIYQFRRQGRTNEHTYFIASKTQLIILIHIVVLYTNMYKYTFVYVCMYIIYYNIYMHTYTKVYLVMFLLVHSLHCNYWFVIFTCDYKLTLNTGNATLGVRAIQ